MTGRTVQQIADRYRHFAEVEAVHVFPRYAAFAAGIAADPDVLAFLADLPPAEQQPHLLPVRWISQEGWDVLPAVPDRLPTEERDRPGQLVLALDGEPVALTAPHGGELRWLPTS